MPTTRADRFHHPVHIKLICQQKLESARYTIIGQDGICSSNSPPCGSGLGGRPSRELYPRHYTITKRITRSLNVQCESPNPNPSVTDQSPIPRMLPHSIVVERRTRSRAPSLQLPRDFSDGPPLKPASFHSITSPPPEHDAGVRRRRARVRPASVMKS